MHIEDQTEGGGGGGEPLSKAESRYHTRACPIEQITCCYFCLGRMPQKTLSCGSHALVKTVSRLTGSCGIRRENKAHHAD